MSQPLRAARRRVPPAERREQILAAALRCFAGHGYHTATMDHLAREAGLSKGSLYWHFSSKEEVFLALFDAFSAELFSAWEETAQHPGSALELLRRQGEIAIEYMTSQLALLDAWVEFLAHRAARERMADAYRTSRALLGDWIRRGIEAGEVRPLGVESTAALATAVVEGLMLQAVVDPDFDPRAHWSEAFETIRRGLAA